MPSPVRSEGRRPRLDLSQASRSDTGGDRGTLGSGVPRSRAKRIHKTSTSPAHLVQWPASHEISMEASHGTIAHFLELALVTLQEHVDVLCMR